MLEGEFPMRFRRAATCAVSLLLWSGIARAEAQEQCVRGDCEYRFDDGDVNSPGYSAYGEWFKLRPKTPRATLIRPRVSYVMELVKSTQSIW
jgi:hypothetical protein